jgi:hypothetical protein
MNAHTTGQDSRQHPRRRQRGSWARRVLVLLSLAAWTMTTGVQWDVLQIIAYGGMAANYTASEHVSLAAAVKKAVSGKNPCDLCVFIADARAEFAENADGPAADIPAKSVPAKKDFPKKLLFALSAAADLSPGATLLFLSPRPAAARCPASPVLKVPTPPPRG